MSTQALKPTERKSPIPGLSSQEFYQCPPQLRRLALYIADCDEPLTIKECAERAGLNYDSLKTQMSRLRRKGVEFNDLFCQIFKKKFKHSLPKILKKLEELAATGSPPHLKMFLQIVGELVPEDKKVEVNLNLVRFASAPTVMPNIEPGDTIIKAKVNLVENGNGEERKRH